MDGSPQLLSVRLNRANILLGMLLENVKIYKGFLQEVRFTSRGRDQPEYKSSVVPKVDGANLVGIWWGHRSRQASHYLSPWVLIIR